MKYTVRITCYFVKTRLFQVEAESKEEAEDKMSQRHMEQDCDVHVKGLTFKHVPHNILGSIKVYEHADGSPW